MPNQTTRLIPCQTTTTARNLSRTTVSPEMGRYPRSSALPCWLQLGLAVSLYAETQGCLWQLFWLVGQIRKGYRGLQQGLQQKVGPRTSPSTGLHLHLCCPSMDFLGSWRGLQQGRKYTTCETGAHASGLSIMFTFPLTHNHACGCIEFPTPFCYKILMNSFAIPNFQQLMGELVCDVQSFDISPSWP